MPFTDQKPRIATEKECQSKWEGGKPGERFRCNFCGFKFKVGDYWRWVYDNDGTGNGGNFITCHDCDGDDVRDRWHKLHEMLQKIWWLEY